MKICTGVLLLCGLAAAQFGGFGNFANRVNNGISNAVSRVPKFPQVANFADFVQKTGKSYANAAEQQLRQGIFASRKAIVDTNNAAFSSGLSTFKTAINAFSDLSTEEFLKKFTGNRKSSAGEQKAQKNRKPVELPASAKIPDAFDWRSKGGVTPVKFQDECGSCWAFATTGAIEGHVFRKTGTLNSLSEQNLVDCGKEEYGLNGCDGGYQEYAFDLVKTQNGIAKGDSYPYVDKKGDCQYSDKQKGAQITGFATIKEGDETTMKKVIATLGPLACSVNVVESMLVYDSGIFSDEKCNEGEVNHSILVVGYGTEKNADYWIVKNSWNSTWGEEGYFRLPRGKNFCGIASECSYPTL